MSAPWHTQHRHYRDLHRRLGDEGFVVDGARESKQLILSLRRDGRTVTVSVPRVPKRPDDAVKTVVQKALRATRDPG